VAEQTFAPSGVAEGPGSRARQWRGRGWRFAALVALITGCLALDPAQAGAAYVPTADIQVQSSWTASIGTDMGTVTVTVTNLGPDTVNGMWIRTFVAKNSYIDGWTTNSVTPCWDKGADFLVFCHHNKLRPQQAIRIDISVNCGGVAISSYSEGNLHPWVDPNPANNKHWLSLPCP
jgi:hypothetical protein